MARNRNTMCEVAGTEAAINKWQLLCLIFIKTNNFYLFIYFPCPFLRGGPGKASTAHGDLFRPGRRFLSLTESGHLPRSYYLQRFWSPPRAVAPRAPRASLRPCSSGIYGARPPAQAQVCAFRFSFRVSPAALAGGRGEGSGAPTARSSGGPGVGRRRPGAPGGRWAADTAR